MSEQVAIEAVGEVSFDESSLFEISSLIRLKLEASSKLTCWQVHCNPLIHNSWSYSSEPDTYIVLGKDNYSVEIQL